MQDISWACFVMPEARSQLSLKRQMTSSAVLGKPCHWTVPGSSPPTDGLESRSLDLERLPGGGGRVPGRERASQQKTLHSWSPGKTPFCSLQIQHVCGGRPASAVSCGVSWTQEKPQTSALGVSPRGADLNLAASPRPGWPPNLDLPEKPGREQGLDFPLGSSQQESQKQKAMWY